MCHYPLQSSEIKVLQHFLPFCEGATFFGVVGTRHKAVESITAGSGASYNGYPPPVHQYGVYPILAWMQPIFTNYFYRGCESSFWKGATSFFNYTSSTFSFSLFQRSFSSSMLTLCLSSLTLFNTISSFLTLVAFHFGLAEEEHWLPVN